VSLLSRVAERIYWTARYLERAETTSRLARVYGNLLLDLPRAGDQNGRLARKAAAQLDRRRAGCLGNVGEPQRAPAALGGEPEGGGDEILDIARRVGHGPAILSDPCRNGSLSPRARGRVASPRRSLGS